MDANREPTQVDAVLDNDVKQTSAAESAVTSAPTLRVEQLAVPKVTLPESVAKERQELQSQKALKEKRDKIARDVFSARATQLLQAQQAKLAEDVQLFAKARTRHAARRISRWWRTEAQTTKKLANDFAAFNLSVTELENAGPSAVETLMSKLQSKELLKITSSLLVRFAQLSKHRLRVHTRMYLSCYMMLAEPSIILGESGPLEEAVLDAAKAMVSHIDTLVTAILSGDHSPTQNQYQQIAPLWNAFAMSFQQWKAKDMSSLIANLVRSYIELEQARDTILASGESKEPEVWQKEISTKQKGIRRHLVKVVGSAEEADSMLQQALAALHEAQRRAAVPPTDSPSDDAKDQSTVHDDAVDSTSASPTTAARAASPTTARTPSPRALQVDANEQIAHELIMEGPAMSFKSDDESGLSTTPIVNNLQEIAERAFWDGVSARLEASPPDYRQVPVLFAEVREALISLIPNRPAISAAMRTDLDATLLEQQLVHNAFDGEAFIGYLQLVMNKVRMLEAPARDEATSAWLAEMKERISSATTTSDTANAVVAVFKYLFAKIKEIKQDIVNFKLQSLAPWIRKNAVDFERGKFLKHLDNGDFDLTQTRAWLSAYASATDVQSAHRRGVAHLIASSTAISLENAPETMRLDIARLNGLQNEHQRIAILATIFSVMSQLLASYKVQVTSSEYQVISHKLSVLLASPTTRLGDITAQVVAEVDTAVESQGKQLSTQHRDLVRNLIAKSISPTDGVYQLMSSRIADAIASDLEQPAKDTDTPYHASLKSVAVEVSRLSAKLAPWADYNWRVHAPFYQQAVQDGASSTSSS